MSRSERKTARAIENGAKPRSAPLALATARVAQHDYIDDALDGVVTAVDDLVRDLGTEALESRRRSYRAAMPLAPLPPELAAAEVRSRRSGKRHIARNVALVVVALLFVMIIEYLLLEVIISSP